MSWERFPDRVADNVASVNELPGPAGFGDAAIEGVGTH
jgi:hypothetical protein